jgi:hypothetical protein
MAEDLPVSKAILQSFLTDFGDHCHSLYDLI